MANFAHLTLIL